MSKLRLDPELVAIQQKLMLSNPFVGLIDRKVDAALRELTDLSVEINALSSVLEDRLSAHARRYDAPDPFDKH